MLKRSSVGINLINVKLISAMTLIAGAASVIPTMVYGEAAPATSTATAPAAPAAPAETSTSSAPAAAKSSSGGTRAASSTPAARAATGDGFLVTRKTPLVGKTFADKLTLAYRGTYEGPSLADPGNPFQPDENGVLGPPTDWDMALTLGYKIPNGAKLAFQAKAKWIPVQENQDFTWKDPRIGVSKPDLFKIGEAGVTGVFQVEPPLTEASRVGNKIAALRFTFLPSYTFPESSWSLDFAQVTIVTLKSKYPENADSAFNNPGGTAAVGGLNATDDYALTLVFDAGVGYSFSDNVSASATYEMVGVSAPPKKLTEIDSGGANSLQFALSFTLHKMLTVSPSLLMYPGHKVKPEAMNLGLELTGAFL